MRSSSIASYWCGSLERAGRIHRRAAACCGGGACVLVCGALRLWVELWAVVCMTPVLAAARFGHRVAAQRRSALHAPPSVATLHLARPLRRPRMRPVCRRSSAAATTLATPPMSSPGCCRAASNAFASCMGRAAAARTALSLASRRSVSSAVSRAPENGLSPGFQTGGTLARGFPMRW